LNIKSSPDIFKTTVGWEGSSSEIWWKRLESEDEENLIPASGAYPKIWEENLYFLPPKTDSTGTL